METLNSRSRLTRQRGSSLVEALVATVVMAFGMIAVSGIQGRLRYSGDHAHQKAEAVRMAQAEMERLRAYVALSRSVDVPEEALVFEEIVSGTKSLDAASTTFQLSRAVANLEDGSKEVLVKISWTDRIKDAEEPMEMSWKTAVARVDPVLVAAARAAPEFGVGQRRAQDRHPGIPTGARKLDASRSLFKPVPDGKVALVFNNTNGMVTGLCDVASGTRTETLGEEDIARCTASSEGGGYLLSGHVLYALGLEPDPGAASDAVVPTSLVVNLSGGEYPSAPRCFTDASRNADAGVRALDYYCVIAPPVRSSSSGSELAYSWSGRSELGSLPLASEGYRVCRYSDDLNGDGLISNAEHPASYSKVTESLSRQNFLVVRFEASCPAGQRIDISAQRYRSTVTVLHQPSS